jgi:hypothetical protein
MKFHPFGVPTPVVLSQPGLVVSEESVPKVTVINAAFQIDS